MGPRSVIIRYLRQYMFFWNSIDIRRRIFLIEIIIWWKAIVDHFGPFADNKLPSLNQSNNNRSNSLNALYRKL